MQAIFGKSPECETMIMPLIAISVFKLTNKHQGDMKVRRSTRRMPQHSVKLLLYFLCENRRTGFLAASLGRQERGEGRETTAGIFSAAPSYVLRF
jgi:hypothetical protein